MQVIFQINLFCLISEPSFAVMEALRSVCNGQGVGLVNCDQEVAGSTPGCSTFM